MIHSQTIVILNEVEMIHSQTIEEVYQPYHDNSHFDNINVLSIHYASQVFS